MYVVAHFHAMILLSIVPAGFAALYVMIPMMTKRMWYSAKMSWIHFWGYLIGASMVVLGFTYLGIGGLIRKEMVYPISSTFVDGQLIATAGAVIADLATVVWLINVVLTLVKGRVAETEGMSLGELTTSIAMALNGDYDIVSNGVIKGITFVKSEIQNFSIKRKL